ncbi:MAG: NAD(P)-dependent dehydrogenase (short-subunit alcohol dehydrogenase family) [Candidatus Azotimanducaceae bacterium]
MNDLEGKCFVLFGAGGLIGQILLQNLLDAGALVCAADNSQVALDRLAEKYIGNTQVFVEYVDIADAGLLAALFLSVKARVGRVDGAINTSYPRNPNYGRHFFDVTYEDFGENLQLHLGGYFMVLQQAAKFALDQDSKFSLVQFSSIYGVIPPKFSIYAGTQMTTPVEYAAIKSALLHLTSYATAYTKGSKFRVNCISPGGILDRQPESFLENYRAQCQSKGMLDPGDIVGSVLFLCSDQSQYVCGQNIVVDDGFTV